MEARSIASLDLRKYGEMEISKGSMHALAFCRLFTEGKPGLNLRMIVRYNNLAIYLAIRINICTFVQNY